MKHLTTTGNRTCFLRGHQWNFHPLKLACIRFIHREGVTILDLLSLWNLRKNTMPRRAHRDQLALQFMLRDSKLAEAIKMAHVYAVIELHQYAHLIR